MNGLNVRKSKGKAKILSDGKFWGAPIQSLSLTPIEWPKCKENQRKSEDSEVRSGDGKFSGAPIQSLSLTPIEWPKCKENRRKSEDSDQTKSKVLKEEAVMGRAAAGRRTG